VALDTEIRDFLEDTRFAVLATANADGSPQQTVMWYELQGVQIMMNTRRGRKKDRNLLRDQRLSICVEDGQRFVTIEGVAELIDDHERTQADIKALATRYEGASRAEDMMVESFSRQHRITILLPIERVITHGFDEA
jgi:PPOX class probable F420-dependent enzyme